MVSLVLISIKVNYSTFFQSLLSTCRATSKLTTQSNMADILTLLLLVIVGLLLFVINVSANDNFFLDDGTNKVYTETVIINQVERVTLLQCNHRCRRTDNCKHIAFDGGTCIMLKAVNFTQGENGPNIYSPVKIMKPG